MTLKEKELKKEISKWRSKAIEYRKAYNSVNTQAKEVIDDLRKTLNWYKNNAWKATFISLINKFKKNGK